MFKLMLNLLLLKLKGSAVWFCVIIILKLIWTRRTLTLVWQPHNWMFLFQALVSIFYFVQLGVVTRSMPSLLGIAVDILLENQCNLLLKRTQVVLILLNSQMVKTGEKKILTLYTLIFVYMYIPNCFLKISLKYII